MTDSIESKRVASTIRERLTDLLKDYLEENIGEEILSCYYEGFTVDQVARDLNTAIKAWANEDSNIQALTELVVDCADDYIE